MKRIRILAAAMTATTLLTLGACGSDDPEASAPATSAPTPSAAPTTTPAPSAATTPTPSASATSAAPRGTLIDYEAIDENGITITTAADTSKLTGAPADFKAFIAATIKQQAATETEGCTEAPQISVTSLDTGGWARGNYFIPGCGGAAALWSNAKGAWTTAWEGQALVDCTTLNAYRFPTRVAGTSCDDGSGQTPYSR